MLGGEGRDAALATLGRAVVCGEIRQLYLSKCGIGPAALAQLATADGGFTPSTALTFLDLSGNQLTRTPNVSLKKTNAKHEEAGHGEPSKPIERWVDYDVRGFRDLCASVRLSCMQTLDLRCAGLGPKAAEELAAAGIGPRVEQLLIAENYIGDIGIKILAGPIANSAISLLDLRNNRLTDSAVVDLSNCYVDVWQERSKLAGVDSLPEPMHLTELDLSNNHLSHIGKAAISPLLHA
eukprot:SAG11_NODE_9419_length_913_cov_1.598280_2_plen_236_part_01